MKEYHVAILESTQENQMPKDFKGNSVEIRGENEYNDTWVCKECGHTEWEEIYMCDECGDTGSAEICGCGGTTSEIRRCEKCATEFDY